MRREHDRDRAFQLAFDYRNLEEKKIKLKKKQTKKFVYQRSTKTCRVVAWALKYNFNAAALTHNQQQQQDTETSIEAN